MENPRITFDKNRKANKSQEFNRLFKDMYIFDKKEKRGLGKTNEEKQILKNNQFIPGKIYTYRYDPLYKDVLDYYDTRPIIMVRNTFFAEGTKNWILEGVNFNFLPPQAKVLTLEHFWKHFQNEIEQSEIYAKNDLIYKSISKILYFFSQWKAILSVFENKVDYTFAYRNYIIDRIEDLRYVEYQHWQLIPFLEPKEIIGESLSTIYQLYLQNR